MTTPDREPDAATRNPPLTLAPSRPLPPPRGMRPEGRKVWRAIVGSFPASFFRPSDEPLLTAYVAAALTHAEAAKAIARDGLFMTHNGQVYANPAVAVARQAAMTLATLGTKARINPSSRMRSEDAHALARRTPNGTRRPWEG
ncbi:P27 family predicted phage terminase small subunit [Paraburkholderia unamae]|uniref:P27 family phage terminase small subunit n=1 Tax=Paraburkholderia unamae TaxID=219649 RepID=UPI000DC4873B|nr:P27 family phage terminase small subunit [Paraburkholderia unamae]RAR51464.1 P27 family predicted phage terminase small subunit [Paraburkholderia unamae]